MKMFASFLIFICFFGANIFGFQISTTNIDVKAINLQFETPVIIKNKETFISLQRVHKPLKSSLSYSSFDQGFELNSKAYQFHGLFFINSKEVLINNQPHFLNQASFIFNQELYVPLTDFLDLFSYGNLAKNNNNQEPHQKRPFSHVKKNNYSDNLEIPQCEQNSKSHLNYHHLSISLFKKLHYKNHTCFIDALFLLEKLNYIITKDDEQLILSKNNITLTIPFNSRFWFKQENGHRFNFKAEATILNNNQSILIPYQSLFSFLGFRVKKKRFSDDFMLLAEIKHIDFHKHSSSIIELRSDHQLYPESNIIQQSKNSFTTTIPYSFISKKVNQPIDDISSIKKFTLKNTRSFETKLILKAVDMTHHPHIKSLPNGLSFHLTPTVKQIKEIQTHAKDSLLITLSAPLKPTFIKSTKEKKLIIDIVNGINQLKPLTIAQNKAYKSVRTSQYKESPLTTRIVIDFESELPKYKTLITSNKILVSFEKTIPKPSSKSQILASVSQKKKLTNSTKSYSSLRDKIIIIDAGHGGRDPGAVVHSKIYEKNYNLDIAKKLEKKLRSEGAYVIMTRRHDHSLPLSKRPQIANKNNADIFISIHLNSFTSSKVNGTETYYYKKKDYWLAKHVQKQLSKDLALKNNGVKRSKLYVLRNSKVSSCLIETLYMTNPKELRLVRSSKYRSKIATSIYQGIKNYFNEIQS